MQSKVKRMLAFGAFLAAVYFILGMHPSLELMNIEDPAIEEKTLRLENRKSTCDGPLTLFFVKIHKAGSTTVRTVLEKFKKKREPQRKIAPYPFPYTGGYPGHFRHDLAVVCTNNTKCEMLNSIIRRADLHTEHCIFNKEEVAKSINPKAKYVTTIRDPFNQFESSYHYFFAKYGSGGYWPNHKVPCFFYPYLYVTGGRWVDISQYVGMAGKNLNESAPWFFRSRNSQSYELGLDPLRLDEEYAHQEAKKLNDTFDLVMIFEHLLESLILLKDLLCMDWDDIVPGPPNNAGKYSKHDFTQEERSIVEKLTVQDRILYNYFNKTLWRKVDEYGHDRMKEDRAKLQTLMEKKWAKTKYDPGKPTKPKPLTRAPIVVRKKQDLETEELNIFRAILKSPNKPKKFAVDNGTAHKIARHMVAGHGWCPTLF